MLAIFTIKRVNKEWINVIVMEMQVAICSNLNLKSIHKVTEDIISPYHLVYKIYQQKEISLIVNH